jgi:hypothetical protein
MELEKKNTGVDYIWTKTLSERPYLGHWESTYKQCCGSGIKKSRIPDPDFYPFRIPDLGSPIPKQQQKRGVKKN